MADVKISQLPAATTPLAGTEEVPLVQSGVTKKATVDEIVAAAGAVTSVTATSPLASSGGSTPDISLSGVIDVAHGGTNATTASGARTNLGAAASGANSDITSMSGITGAIGTADYVAFDTAYSTTLAAGQLGWDGNNTLGLGMAGGNVIQHIGEDSFYYIKASSTITKGQVVMFTGAVGASGVPTGAPATGVTDGSYIMGVAAEGIANNAFGLVQFQGTLRNVNTSGFTDGDVLWYDPAVTGGLTKTKPSAPNVKVQVAATVNGGSVGGGTILVRVNAGSVLGGTDSNVQFGTLANGDLIQYNSTGGYWQNVPAATAAVTTISGGTTGLTPASATAGAVTLGGTLVVANGGTGATTAAGARTNLGLGTISTQNANSVSITGGSIDGTAIGATTPTTGAFTTLSASSDVTLSGGTANGVAYLNGSKVLTTGSALTFDGSTLNINQALNVTDGTDTLRSVVAGSVAYFGSSTNVPIAFRINSAEQMRLTSTGLGIGTSSPTNRLEVASSTTNTGITIYNNNGSGGQNARLGFKSLNGYDASSVLAAVTAVPNASGNTATSLVFSTSGDNNIASAGLTERMRLDSSGNLGIGTSSFTWLASGSETGVNIKSSGGNAAGINVSSSNANNTRMEMFAAYSLNQGGFYLKGDSAFPSMVFGQVSGSTYRDSMLLDSFGNFGLGVTPSAWNAGKAFEIGGVGAALWNANNAGDIFLTSNVYYNSGFKYAATNAASYYEQNAGVHKWGIAASGTAGNAISFTQAMTLDAGGNLLVGTTSSYFGATGRGTIELNGSSDSIFGMKAGGTVYGYLYSSASEFRVGNITANPLTFYTNNTERARIDSSGNVGINTTTPGDKLEIGGAGAGIILASPNGTRYRLTVTNLGVLSITAV